jgi:hypothetical protein
VLGLITEAEQARSRAEAARDFVRRRHAETMGVIRGHLA